MTLQEQAWASVSPASVLGELKKAHTVKIDGDKLIVSPPPAPKLAWQIRHNKPKLMELLGHGKTLSQRITEAQEQLGWKTVEEKEERLAIQTEHAYRDKCITFSYGANESKLVEAPWPAPVIDRSIQQQYCQHRTAGEYRRNVDGQVIVQLLCPECGHNLKGPRSNKPYQKRTNIPWWPENSPVIPDPDAPTDELVEWWQTVEANVTDGSIFSPGITVGCSKQFKASLTELIGLWRLGDPDIGLSAQLGAHRAYLKQLEADK